MNRPVTIDGKYYSVVRNEKGMEVRHKNKRVKITKKLRKDIYDALRQDV